jgi:tetratricopeptide (TPR) repeat protein
MRVLGIGPVGSLVAAGALERGQRTVLADFQSQTGDSTLAAAVTEAFRIDVAQSQLITIVPPNHISGVLLRMRRDPRQRLDLELAREVAIREGYKAVIAGAINAVGASYVLSAQLIAPESGDELAAFRVTASDSTAVIGAIDKLSKKMRERIGESLRSIRANEPLETVTTSSLEALRLYSRAWRAIEVEWNNETGIALLEEALAQDSTFAMAWRKLGIALGRRGGADASELAAYEKAYELRDRLTGRERYVTTGTYYWFVVDDREKAIAAYRSLLDRYPDDVLGLMNLSGIYGFQRDHERALELRRRALALDPWNASLYWGQTSTHVDLGDWAAAESAVEALAGALPGLTGVEFLRGFLAYSRGDYPAAWEHFLALRDDERAGLQWQAAASGSLALVAATRGQLEVSEQHSHDAAIADQERGQPDARRQEAIYSAGRDLRFRGDAVGALRKVDEALERFPLDDQEPLNRPYLDLASFYAWAGAPDRARELVAEWESEIDPRVQRGIERKHGVRGEIALAEGRFEEAIEGFRAWDRRTDCTICALPGLANAYDRAGVPDSAIAVYERYITTPMLLRYSDAWALAVAFGRLGELYEERGEADRAIYYYGKLVELWSDADPELQPRVEAARRAIEALSTDR